MLPVSPPGRIAIRGTSGVAIASGLRWYLRHVANVSVAYGNASVPAAAVPDVWPAVATEVDVESPVRWRYYMNVVTHSYAAPWWNWDRWAAEVDWMALMGINMPLAFTGQEYVWDRVYRERMNLTEEDMAAHFAGPAFLAWGRMGNIRGWGGTLDAHNGTPAITGLTRNWMVQQADLQRRIVARERALGMRTVLPAFAGHVPIALERTGARMTRSKSWCHFGGRFSEVGLLDAGDPAFRKIGAALVEILTEEFGTDHFYNGDTFNEMGPNSTAPDYVRAWGSAVYDAMAAADPQATWFVQGWSLSRWADGELAAYWSGVPEGRILSLDLNCAQSSRSWHKYTSAISPGRPVVCGLLDNMGGKRALGGNLPTIASQLNANVAAAGTAPRTGDPLIAGLGWNPEDLHQNPIKWHLMGEVGWRNASLQITDLAGWVRGYAAARYAPHGGAPGVAAAWDALFQAAYQAPNHATGSAADGVCRMPSTKGGVTRSPNATGVVVAARLLTAAAKAEPALGAVAAFRYDLVDVVRQVLQDRFADEFGALQDACTNSTDIIADACRSACNGTRGPGAAIVSLAADLDRVLSADPHFLMGRWVADARSWGADAAERDWLEWNARMQVTLWGGSINNYAAKQWGGLVAGYYLPMWRHFLSRVAAGVSTGTAAHECSAMAHGWVTATSPSMPAGPVGDAVSIADELLAKWFPR